MSTKSFETKQLLNTFGSDLRRISGNLYQALSGDVPSGDRQSAIAAGKKKVADYEALLESLDGVRKAAAVERFGEVVQRIRDHLSKAGA
jgi:hypothetical protein